MERAKMDWSSVVSFDELSERVVWVDGMPVADIYRNGVYVGSEWAVAYSYNLYLTGAENQRRGETFCNGYCYRGIYDHGKRLAQLEVVADGLVLVGCIKGKDAEKDVEKVCKQLKRLGFCGRHGISVEKEYISDVKTCAAVYTEQFGTIYFF